MYVLYMNIIHVHPYCSKVRAHLPVTVAFTEVPSTGILALKGPLAPVLDPCLRKHVKPLVHIHLQSYTYIIFAYIRHYKTLFGEYT